MYKAALASRLLGVTLYDGLDQALGTVEEAIVEPESGKLGFYLVRPSQGQGQVIVWAYPVKESLRKAKVRSHARLAAASS